MSGKYNGIENRKTGRVTIGEKDGKIDIANPVIGNYDGNIARVRNRKCRGNRKLV